MQLARQWRLLRALQAAPAGTGFRELMRAAGARQRTVYRDLETLRAAGFPLAHRVERGRPVWELAGEHAPALRFTPAELTALSLARQMLLSLPGSPFEGAMRSAFHKLQSACDRDGLRVIESTDRRIWAGLRRGRAYTQRQVWFRVLVDAITRQRTVRLRYWTRERDAETDRDVDPYGLVLHEGAFYLVGWCRWRRGVRVFLLDRVRQATARPSHFTPPEGFSVRDYFRDAWGVIKARSLESVRIRFGPAAARLVREGRWHESQRFEDGPAGAVDLTVRVAGWTELLPWVLSYGADAEVLEPAALRAAVVAEAARVDAVYRPGRGS